MKLSINNLTSLARRAMIKLDGIIQHKVLEVDDEAGYIVRYKLDTFGKPIPNADNEAYLTEKVYGNVEIIDPESEERNG